MKFSLPAWLSLVAILSILVSLSTECVGQDTRPMRFRSYARQLCVSGDGSAVITTKAGEVAITASPGQPWEMRSPSPGKNPLGLTIDQSNFFNRDTGFASGFLQGSFPNYDIIYRTVNGGLSWDTVNFGQSGWVDDAVYLPNGEAWLSVAGSGFAYTKDYGLHWEKIAKPANRERYAHIYFNEKREALIGSLWNSLAYSADNGTNWQILPTPLDQQAYRKSNTSQRPEFNAVAIFGKFLLVKQKDMVFYSERSPVRWRAMENIRSFHTDAANTALFGITANGDCLRFDSLLHPQQYYPFGKLVTSITCLDSSLYLYSGDSLYCWNAAAQMEATPVYCTGSTLLEPEYIYASGMFAYGRDGRRIFRMNNYGSWTHVASVPPEESASVVSVESDSVLLCHRAKDTLVYYSFTGKELKRLSVAGRLKEFLRPGLNQLCFAKGSRGCFHYYEERIDYTLFNGEFRGGIGYSKGQSGGRIELPENPAVIDLEQVLVFLASIPFPEGNSFPSIEDLEFSDGDYRRCRTDIQAFVANHANQKMKKKLAFDFPRNNLDFNRLLSLVDSVRLLSPKELDAIMYRPEEILSTTSQWDAIHLVNNNNEVLSIQAGGWDQPWVLRYGGAQVSLPNWPVNCFMDQLYPGFITYAPKNEQLHRIVKYLYDRK